MIKSDFDELYGKQLLPRNTENSNDSDTPISTYIQRKQTSNTYKQKPQKPGSIENKENSEETVVTEVLSAEILDGPDLLQVLETASSPSMTQYE